MGERKLIHHRCLAVQLLKKESLVSSPVSSDSSSGDTATPVNDLATTATTPALQDGLHLFRVWQAANVECAWDKELVEAAKAVQYLGHLVGGVVLVGGPANALATLSLAWSRSLLAAPSGYSLTMLGEVQGLSVAVVPQGQFTPLADALCWVVHHLTRDGCKAGAEAVREALEVSFPTMMPPVPSHVHAILSSLIQQCKVYYTGTTYGIVQPGTYRPFLAPPAAPPSATSPVMMRDGMMTSAAQTDLAELITGAAQSSDRVIAPTLPGGGSGMKTKASSDTEHIDHHPLYTNHHRHHHNAGRAASLRLSPARASILATHLAAAAAAAATTTVHTYQALNFSDISIRGERGSMFSKLLRVPGRRRIASFAAQFPPPEWNDSQAPVIHLHSVAVQTSTQQNEVKAWHWSASQWTPRSATLPRRLRRPQSSSPPPPKSQQSSPVPRGFTSLLQVHVPVPHHMSPPRHHNHADRRSRSYRFHSPGHQRNETRSCHSSSSEDIADHRPPVTQNYHAKRGNQTGDQCLKGKEQSVAFMSPAGAKVYKQQAVDPSKSEERLLEMMQDSHLRSDENDVTGGRQQSCKPRQEKVNHRRSATGHPPHNRHIKPRKHKPPDGKFEKNQQARNSQASLENQVHIVSQDENTPDDIKQVMKNATEVMQSDSGKEKHLYQRSNLQLDLTQDHMNNCRKVVASPQRPHGLTTNLLHQAPDLQHITKGSTPDLTSRNLGYQEVDKCHKKMCSQTLDQLHKPPPPPASHSRKSVGSPGSKGSPGGLEEGDAGLDKRSVSTYPSLSELNLTFSSLAAQKILSGVSVNSLDTLAEVNMAALKHKSNTVTSALTNTDLGFV